MLSGIMDFYKMQEIDRLEFMGKGKSQSICGSAVTLSEVRIWY